MKTVLNATVFISLFCLSSGCSGSSPGKQDAVVDEQYDIAPEVASSDVETGENDGDFPGIPDAVEENESSAVDDAGETVEQDTGKDASDATEATDAVITASTLVLDPASLIFFSLPINSIRYAVSGHDKQTNTCVTIIWDYSNNGEYLGAHCGHFYPGFPYVIVKPDEPETCGIWNYGSNDPVLEKAEGCVDFKELGNTNMDMVDVELTVKGDIFTGKIIAGNRSYIIPAPVSMGIEYTTDIPEDVYVQAGNALGLPDWVVVKKEGVQLKIFDQCDIPACGGSGGVCGQALPWVINFTNGSYSGDVYLTWDGKIRTIDPIGNCLKAEPAEPGQYTAEFCFGWQVSKDGGKSEVIKPSCYEVQFTMPAEKVVFYANFGG